MTETGDNPRRQPTEDSYDEQRGEDRVPGDRAVPGVGGAVESSADGQKGLQLHIGIAVIATVLSVLVAVVFAGMGSWPLAVVFAVIALASLGALGWAWRHKHRGANLRTLRAEQRSTTAPQQDQDGRG